MVERPSPIGDVVEGEMEEAEETDDQVELQLRVRQGRIGWMINEKIEVVRVRPDAVDLTIFLY